MDINSFINRYFGLILLSAALVGLAVPFKTQHLDAIILCSLGFIIFASFFKTGLERRVLTTGIGSVLNYFLLRFTLLPVVVYFVLGNLSVHYAISFFLLLMLPSAVSSPAFTGMFNGNISLSLKLLVTTSFLSIVTIPLLSSLFLREGVRIDSFKMFLTMVYTIIIPFVIHLPLRRIEGLKDTVVKNNPVITAIGLIVIFVFATSHNRQIIISAPEKMALYALVSLLAYLLIYLIGYYIPRKAAKADKIAYSVSSGANNVGLGVSLTALFFPGDINVFFIVAQLAWIFILIPMRFFYQRAS